MAMAEVEERVRRPAAIVVGIEWIVCRGETRDVVEGIVDCPGQGVIGVTECTHCRHLQALQAEWRQPGCGTADR